jgi:acetyl esterase/lipase
MRTSIFLVKRHSGVRNETREWRNRAAKQLGAAERRDGTQPSESHNSRLPIPFSSLGDRRDPLASPTHGDLGGLPPVYIQVGGYETLLDDSHILAAALRWAGVEVKIDVYPEMQHVFHFLAGTAPEADEAIGQPAAWVRPKLGLG